MRTRTATFALILCASWPSLGDEPSPRPAVRGRLVRPELEVEKVIALFRGAKATDPAQALAAWKRASQEPKRLGKPLEAAIAAINPRMAAELATLDRAEVGIGFEENFTRANWWAAIPRDDGTFAALGTALVLSGGGVEPPLGDLAVDRLGPPGSALMVRSPRELILAGSRRDLESALARSRWKPGQDIGMSASGWRAEIDPRALAIRALSPLPLPLRALVVAGCRNIEATAGIDGTAIDIVTNAYFHATPFPVLSRIEPRWLDPIPAETAVAGAAFAIEPTAWDPAFALADRVEKDDPARADVAPIRLRIGLLARAFGVRFEADLVPDVRGFSAWVGSRSGKTVDRGMVAAHFVDEAAASRVFGRIKPQAPLTLDRRGQTLLIAWGADAMRDSLDALDHPERSAGPILRSTWDIPAPFRAGGLWPARVPGFLPASSPLAAALAESPPVIWTGKCYGPLLQDRVRWEGLDATIRRFLDLLPLDPPPDR